ncbi:hypothetical protein K2173_020489 [Erythroxylum novogranatense]|uniref:Myb-like domain-containing protein n=1 Tax=Erythroxylum novogranatense TaxID=1862640 RepID=A0AAV8TGV7_9ROSI|nr:hypothetical protein K2173_020489 [Erythroxylum novogranatense]
MGDHQYGFSDLRQLVAGRTHFQGSPQATEPIFGNLAPQRHHHYDSIMVGEVVLPSGFVKLGHDHYCTNFTTATTTTTTTISGGTVGTSSPSGAGLLYGAEMDSSGWMGSNDGNNSRWPRQETLTLLEIRSRLDSRFKEANQKGPLWDEVSRIMAEEHGYQRSGRKCKEKFENLYKYYKKTKEGKAGRQDGKHYRFFRQLEALYGETGNPASTSETNFVNNPPHLQARSSTINQESQELLQENKLSESLSFSNTTEFETSSSENNDDDLSAIASMMNRSKNRKQKGTNESQSYDVTKKPWKAKVKNFVDSQMRKLFETQEAWMERMLKTIEDRENERMSKEEEWMRKEVARFDREHEFWAKERQWFEARDAALMKTLKKHTGKDLQLSLSMDQFAVSSYSKSQETSTKKTSDGDETTNIRWTEPEIISIIQLRTAMETKFQERGYSREGLWEEIAAYMGSLGYHRSVNECKEKWETMNIYFNMTEECNKKRREDMKTDNLFGELESYTGQEVEKQRLESTQNSSFDHRARSFQVGRNEG